MVAALRKKRENVFCSSAVRSPFLRKSTRARSHGSNAGMLCLATQALGVWHSCVFTKKYKRMFGVMTMKLMTAWKKGKEKKMMIFVSLLYINVSPQVRHLRKKNCCFTEKEGKTSFGRLPLHMVCPSTLLHKVFLLLCSIFRTKKWLLNSACECIHREQVLKIVIEKL